MLKCQGLGMPVVALWWLGLAVTNFGWEPTHSPSVHMLLLSAWKIFIFRGIVLIVLNFVVHNNYCEVDENDICTTNL